MTRVKFASPYSLRVRRALIYPITTPDAAPKSADTIVFKVVRIDSLQRATQNRPAFGQQREPSTVVVGETVLSMAA